MLVLSRFVSEVFAPLRFNLAMRCFHLFDCNLNCMVASRSVDHKAFDWNILLEIKRDKGSFANLVSRILHDQNLGTSSSLYGKFLVSSSSAETSRNYLDSSVHMRTLHLNLLVVKSHEKEPIGNIFISCNYDFEFQFLERINKKNGLNV